MDLIQVYQLLKRTLRKHDGDTSVLSAQPPWALSSFTERTADRNTKLLFKCLRSLEDLKPGWESPPVTTVGKWRRCWGES